jgi:hypothetical protein
MQQPMSLFFDRLRDLGMQTARRVDSDSRGEIEEEIAINIADPAAAALLGDNRIEPRHGLAHEFSIERQNLSRLGAWKRRGNSWLMHHAILQISPREKIAPDRRLRQSLKRFPDHHNTRPDAAADVAGKKTLCAVDLARARFAGELRERLSNLPDIGRTDGMAVANQTAASPTLQALLGLTKIYDDVFKPVVGKQLLDNPITLKFRDDPVGTLKFNDDLKSPGLDKPPGLEGKQPGSLLALHFVLFAVADERATAREARAVGVPFPSAPLGGHRDAYCYRRDPSYTRDNSTSCLRSRQRDRPECRCG